MLLFFQLTLFVALVTLGIFLEKADNSTLLYNTFAYYGKKGALEFAIFVLVVAWLLTIGFTIFFVCGVHEKIPVVNWPLTVSMKQ